ncbi:type I restriction-modification system subunit M N-terminal domain-containing protein [Klebsiella variicola subsp. variicola]|nr:type I restriction-modification system subunit M N-terminal domain-containing protein [Klebsiella variicola subsp. variicola]
MNTDNIVQKIWGLCHILRGDGVSYHEYISELTYLLFFKNSRRNQDGKSTPDRKKMGRSGQL